MVFDADSKKQTQQFLIDAITHSIDESYDRSKNETEEYFNETLNDFEEAGYTIDLSKDEDRRRVYREIVLTWLFSMKKKKMRIDTIHRLLIEHYAYSMVLAKANSSK